MRPFFYIANWKMSQSLAGTQEYVQALSHDSDFTSLTPKIKVVLCPSFPSLGLLAQELKNSSIALGAQTCSPHASGPYTGQVAASTLVGVGCTYCLIGHSERRACGETTQQISGQYNQLVNNALTPILCIGESEKEHAAGATTTVLEQQLTPLIKTYQENPATTLLIAYEPVWAIGTGKTPTTTELTTTFSWLKKRLQNDLPEATTFFIYGGSVDETNSAAIKKITHLDGILVGSASLNFKNFKNIVV